MISSSWGVSVGCFGLIAIRFLVLVKSYVKGKKTESRNLKLEVRKRRRKKEKMAQGAELPGNPTHDPRYLSERLPPTKPAAWARDDTKARRVRPGGLWRSRS